MATCVEVGGGHYPRSFRGNPISPMEGISLFRTMAGDSDPQRVLAFEHQGVPAVRVGDWKLVSRNRQSMTGSSFAETPGFELYNLQEDRSETEDLAGEFPEKVEELKAIMRREFIRTQVFPKPGKSNAINALIGSQKVILSL